MSNLRVRVGVAVVLAAAVVATLPACGGDEPSAREQFAEQLQSIDRRGSEQWAKLARSAAHLRPGQALAGEVTQALRDTVEVHGAIADELETLEAPQGVEDEVALLAEALRARTAVFEDALERRRLTQADFARIEGAGEQIDAAFERLRDEGFLPAEEEGEK